MDHNRFNQWLDDTVTHSELTFRFPLDYTTFLIAVQSSIRSPYNKYNFHITQLVIEDNNKDFVVSSVNMPNLDSLNSSLTWLKGQYYVATVGTYLIALMLP